jgi:hypothetical protein
MASGSCEASHQNCEISRPFTLEAFGAAKTGNQSALLRLVAERPELFEVNQSRGVLQIRGCTGGIIGQIALPKAQLAAIGKAQTRIVASASE